MSVSALVSAQDKRQLRSVQLASIGQGHDGNLICGDFADFEHLSDGGEIFHVIPCGITDTAVKVLFQMNT